MPRVFIEKFTPPRTVPAPEERHHLRNVLRLGDGNHVQLFDAHGNEANGTIAGDAIEHAPPTRRERDVTLSVASAVPKGDRVEWLVEKLAELGVASWHPLLTERSTVDPRPGKLEKLRRRVIEAAKQAGTPGVMSIGEPVKLERFLETADGPLHVLSTVDSEPPRPTPGEAATLLIGPEGGWTDRELTLMADRRATAVTLGPTVLRIETAAVVGTGVFATLLRGS